MHLLQRIHPLLQLDVVIRKLGLFVRRSQLFPDILLGPRSERGERCTIENTKSDTCQ